MAGRETTELEALRRSVDQLTQGLLAMVETQATQTEMIRQLLEAATAPIDPEQQTARVLEQTVALLTSHGTQLRTIAVALEDLPAEVGASVAREVSRAMALVK